MAAITQDREMLAAWGLGERAVDALYRKRMALKAPKKAAKVVEVAPIGERMAKSLLAEMPKPCYRPSEETVLRVLSRESETADGAEWAIWQMSLVGKPDNRVLQPRQHLVEVEVKVSLTEGMALGWVGATPVKGARIPRVHKERRVHSRPLPPVTPIGVRLGDVWATTGQPQPVRSVAVKAVKAVRAVEASEPVVARVSRAPQWMRRPEMVSAQ
jgi:hypothetical protein